MNHICRVCGKDSLFFIWSTSRVFNRQKFLDYYRSKFKSVSEGEKESILHGDYIVCQFCMENKDLT